jgi:hypothetical protein
MLAMMIHFIIQETNQKWHVTTCCTIYTKWRTFCFLQKFSDVLGSMKQLVESSLSELLLYFFDRINESQILKFYNYL